MKFTAISKFLFTLLTFIICSYSSVIYSNNQLDVLTETSGVRFESDNNIYWLHFDKDAESLWPVLKHFWEKQGIELSDEQPQFGFMETKWIQDTSEFRSVLLSDRSPEFREKFRLRLERSPDNSGTRVYIYHSSYGILLDEELVYTGYLPAAPELEIEMLARIASFSGMNKDKVQKTITTYIPVKLEAIEIMSNQFQIHMAGSPDFVRKKLTASLDRLNVDFKTDDGGVITATSTKASNLNDKDLVKEKIEWDIDDSSDLEEEGFLTVSEEDLSEIYIIRLIDKSSGIIIDIKSKSKIDRYAVANFSQAIARNLNR